MKYIVLVALLTGFVGNLSAAFGQTITNTVGMPEPDRSVPGPLTTERPIVAQRDILDIMRTIRQGRVRPERDTLKLQRGQPLVWVLPQIGYSPQNGFLAQVLGNVAFRRPGANVSTLVSTLAYTQNNQQLWTNTLNYWLPNNAWNLTADVRLMHYPQATYGLGTLTNTDRVVNMDYEYLRTYATLLRHLAPNFYGGIGLQLDLHWDIQSYDARHERVSISRYAYGVTGRSVSFGPTITLLYDNRPNSINALSGFYANAVFRKNAVRLGSGQSWQSILLDMRKYVPLFRNKSETTLALWSYSFLNISGNPPFLDLPATGWDTSNNTGRGYIQGRFRGKNLLYTEAELRFGITANRLLGGVVFVNAQTVSEPDRTLTQTAPAFRFDHVVPAAGLGLRLRMNKLSRTNLAIDYGIGTNGSHGLYFNLGEVF